MIILCILILTFNSILPPSFSKKFYVLLNFMEENLKYNL